MQIFITGVSGFVGGAIARRWKDKHSVFALARSSESRAKVEAAGVKPIMADLQSLTADQLKGMDVVLHAAARAEDWGTRAEFFAANVEGTQNLLRAAREAGVKRFIFVGTEASFFTGSDMTDIDETTPYPTQHRFLYSETKALAEKMVLDAASENFFTISIRPRFVWGPGDNSVLPTLLAMVEKGQFMWVGGGDYRTDTTYIDNLTHALDLALTEGRNGRAYFVSDGQTQNLKQFLTRLAATHNVQLPEKNIGRVLARSLSVVVEGVWNLLRLKTKPPMTKFAIYMLSSHCTVDIARAREELGYTPEVSVEVGLERLKQVAVGL